MTRLVKRSVKRLCELRSCGKSFDVSPNNFKRRFHDPRCQAAFNNQRRKEISRLITVRAREDNMRRRLRDLPALILREGEPITGGPDLLLRAMMGLGLIHPDKQHTEGHAVIR
jgi:hypothetical protein